MPSALGAVFSEFNVTGWLMQNTAGYEEQNWNPSKWYQRVVTRIEILNLVSLQCAPYLFC